MKIRHIATRFALILALAAVLPLIGYGAWSLFTLQRGTRESIVAGNLNVASRASDEIRRYIVSNAEIIKALGANLQDTNLQAWQQDRILKNYVLQFREFREITLFDEAGAVATSGARMRGHPGGAAADHDGVGMAQSAWTTTCRRRRVCHSSDAVESPWLASAITSKMADGRSIRSGEHGSRWSRGRHADRPRRSDQKALVAQSRNMSSHPWVRSATAGRRRGVTIDANTLNSRVAARTIPR